MKTVNTSEIEERLKRCENEYWAEKAFQAEAEGYIGESESMKVIQAVDCAET